MGEVVDLFPGDDPDPCVCDCQSLMVPMLRYDEEGFAYIAEIVCFECGQYIPLQDGFLMEPDE